MIWAQAAKEFQGGPQGDWTCAAIALGLFALAGFCVWRWTRPEPGPTAALAEAAPVCDHRWANDGERVVKAVYESSMDQMVHAPFQPLRCSRCGDMKSVAL